ncbi:hypothetical protein D1007_32430 [Hordeum vulgare]|nr:hypothetical protein D1007_32430 [Hordeum vulgare]
MINDGHIKYLRRTRKLPSEEVVEAREPGDELVPEHRDGERVIFANHFLVGFGKPTSSFLRHFLQSFGLQMHHQGVNTVLYITCFVTLCKAYLGINPFRPSSPISSTSATRSTTQWITPAPLWDVIELLDVEASALETEQVTSLAVPHAATSGSIGSGTRRQGRADCAHRCRGPIDRGDEGCHDAAAARCSSSEELASAADAHPEVPPEAMSLSAGVPAAQEVVRPASDPEQRTGAETKAPGDSSQAIMLLRRPPWSPDRKCSMPRATGVMARYKKNIVSFVESAVANLKTLEMAPEDSLFA